MPPTISAKPHVIVLSGPSGSGKSTLITKLFEEYPTAFAFSISHTTRSPRPGEQNGREYHFASRPDMEGMLNRGEFLESTEFSGNFKKAVEDVTRTGRICLLDVDKQGVKNIRNSHLDAVFVFISPPSYEILEQRLRGRQTDTEAAIEKRLKEAKESMEFSKEPGVYDHIILNDQLDVAYQSLKDVLREMANQAEQIRLAQAGVHDNPEFVLKYLEEIEALAENVLAERREIIELNKRRDKLREASRAVHKQASNVKTNWMCLNNNFLAMSTRDCKRLIDRDFDQINVEISQAEKKLKENVKKLYDAEKKPEIRGFNLKSLSREERQELDQLLEPYT
ncbi:unnamed protein product [Adineta ricciae]|uniref:guanylate kinase n=1 Tax=Adineta ricciae TaxID=249248 RepID=A0A814QKQ6_ADIRI|nr:unnamed protein product [Adineta ricciae]